MDIYIKQNYFLVMFLAFVNVLFRLAIALDLREGSAIARVSTETDVVEVTMFYKTPIEL